MDDKIFILIVRVKGQEEKRIYTKGNYSLLTRLPLPYEYINYTLLSIDLPLKQDDYVREFLYNHESPENIDIRDNIFKVESKRHMIVIPNFFPNRYLPEYIKELIPDPIGRYINYINHNKISYQCNKTTKHIYIDINWLGNTRYPYVLKLGKPEITKIEAFSDIRIVFS